MGVPSDPVRVIGAFVDAPFYAKTTGGSGATFDHSTKAFLVGRDGRLVGAADLRTPGSERRRSVFRVSRSASVCS